MVQIIVPFSVPGEAPASTPRNTPATPPSTDTNIGSRLAIPTAQTTPQPTTPATPQAGSSYSAAETNARNAERGVVKSARTKMGSPVAGAAVTDNCLVTLRSGQVCDVSLALRLGKLVRHGDGSLTEPGHAPATQQQQPQAPQQADAKDDPKSPDKTDTKTDDAPEYDLFDEAGEALVGEIATGVANTDVEAAIGSVAQGLDVSDTVVGRIASQRHLEPAQVQEQIGEVRELFEMQAQDKVRESGLDPDMLFEWGYRERPKLMEAAIRQHLHSRSTRAYETVMDAYIEDLPNIDPNLALNANFGGAATARKGPRGEILITLPNGLETSWKAAVKAGYIKLGHRRRK